MTFSGFFYIVENVLPFVKEQNQCTPLKTVADRYKKHFIIINKIMKRSNDTGHSLTVCTKTRTVFTLMCMVGVFFPLQSLGKTSACCKKLLHIWVIFFPPYLAIQAIFNARGKLNLKKFLERIWSRPLQLEPGFIQWLGWVHWAH